MKFVVIMIIILQYGGLNSGASGLLCKCASIWTVPQPYFIFRYFLGRISHFCLGMASDHDSPTSWVAGMTGTSHHTWPNIIIIIVIHQLPKMKNWSIRKAMMFWLYWAALTTVKHNHTSECDKALYGVRAILPTSNP